MARFDDDDNDDPLKMNSLHCLELCCILQNTKTFVCLYLACIILKHCKGKTIPLQPWTGPEGSRRLRLPNF
jgi:hypothetical protein